MKVANTLLAAAVGGALLGSIAGCSNTAAPAAPKDPTAAAAPAKHACKGQNDCKAQGGCKTDKHGCKGQNDCKGQGGCKTALFRRLVSLDSPERAAGAATRPCVRG